MDAILNHPGDNRARVHSLCYMTHSVWFCVHHLMSATFILLLLKQSVNRPTIQRLNSQERIPRTGKQELLLHHSNEASSFDGQLLYFSGKFACG